VTNLQKILIVCDTRDDFDEISKIITNTSSDSTLRHVESVNQLFIEFEAVSPDICILDFPSNTFTSPDDIRQITALFPEVPFIVISRADSVSLAVACLKAGAQDYILKSELFRLASCIEEIRTGSETHLPVSNPISQSSKAGITQNGHSAGRRKTITNPQILKNTETELLRINLQLQEKIKGKTLEIQQLSLLNRAIIENVGIAVVSVSKDGLVESFNPAAETLLQYRASEVIGLISPFVFQDMEFFKDKARQLGLINDDNEILDFNPLMNSIIRSLPPSFESTLVRKDGQKVHVLLSLSLLFNSDKVVTGYVGVALDITDRKVAEEAIKVSEQRFHNMFENHDAMMFLVDPETGLIIDANNSARKFYGYDFASGIYIHEINTIPAEEVVIKMAEATRNNRNFFVFNHRIANGDIRAVDLHSTPIEINSKTLLFSIIRDVTDKKRAEDSLKNISLRMTTLLENMQSGILFEDETRHVALVNQAFCNVFGIPAPPQALNGLDCEIAAQASAPLMKDPESFLHRIHKIVDDKIIVLSDEIEFADGAVFERDYIPIVQQDDLLGHLWQYRDITARKKSQETLKWNESLLRLMANSSPLAFFVVDNRTDRIIYFNHRFCEIWEITHLEERMKTGELKNNDIIPDCLPKLSDIEAFAESCTPLQSESNRITIEDIIPFNDGRAIRRFSTQIRGNQDEYYGRLYIFEDITERKQGEHYLAMQRDLGIGLSAVSTMQETLDLAIDTLLKIKIFNCGGIYLLNPVNANLELSISRNISESFIQNASVYTPDTVQSKLVMKGESVYGVFNEVIIQKDESCLNEYLKYITVLPIQNEGKVLGSLNLGSSNSDDFPIKLKHTLEAFASQIGIAIARIQAEEALRTSQQNFHLMFETLDDFMFILNMQGNIIKTNPVVQKRLGYSEKELSKMHVLDVHPADRRIEAGNIVNEMLAGTALFCPVPLVAKDGTLIPVETRVVIGKWDNADALYGISRDVTERMKAESELQLRESFLSAVINNHPGFFWLKDTEGKYIMVNDKNYEYLKYNESIDNKGIIGKTDFDILPREAAEKYMAEDHLIIETRQPIISEEYFILENNDTWYEKFKFPVVDKNGDIIGISGYTIDISERKKSEVQLRMQNAAFESFALAMIITDSNGSIQWANPAFSELTGYQTDEVIGQNPSLLHSWKQDKNFHSLMRQTIESGKIWRGELENKRKDGSTYYEEETITPVFNEKGEILNFIAIKIDITHRKAIEEALRLSEQRWQFALEGSGDGIWDWNVATNEVFYSKQWKAMLGYDNNEISNSINEWTSRIHPDDRESSVGDLEKHFNGENEIYVSEHRMLCKDGSYKWILDRGKTIEWLNKGKPLRVIGTHTDITQRKTLEETLKKGIEKERELNDLKSRFVSTASHEFRTPLASILIISDSLIAYWNKMEESQITSRLDKIKEQILHLSKIVNDVLQLSKIQEGKIELNTEKIDIVSLVEGIIESFDVDNQLQNKIKLECFEKVIMVFLDTRLIQQVLTNLISNAIKYSPENPEIIVRIEKKHSEILIGIHDNGIGIPYEEQKHLFTPFYRAANTKVIPGNGLGLNIVREAIRLMGGEVTFHSVQDKGSSFFVHLQKKYRPSKSQL